MFICVVVVVKKHDTVTLTCSSAQLTGDVTWKLENDEIEVDDDFQLDGQNLKVSGVGTPSLGNYSCWSGEEMLSSTHLLLEAEAEEELDSFFHCWAKSYDCNFSCVWNNSSFEGEKSCDWVSSNNQLPNGGFQFELSHSLSPYAEESTMLKLAVEAMVYPLILRRTKRFYLRDIVQPDSPQIVKCQEVGEEMNVTINPPSSWSTPHSFFRLEHQIQYKLKDDGKVENSSSLLIPKRISKLRVRCRDSVVLSTWSQWTPWKNVTH
ncbi:interleukin-12 subunit beta-like protein [Lates japonicus]|uniref:Interleukin-12 subunit beta-like protein n=1 Tax=Lates japonicus TaxID=270547 RepID=A0AAD3R3K8_LATJO|nr:interleukin-12 subunit beta-like protein [Lates japonicus]